MKQHRTPQRKYATGEKRNGFAGSALLAVAFLLGCMLISILFTPSPVQAAQTATLPALELAVPVYTGKEDGLLQQTEQAIGTEIARIRQLEGLGSVTVSDVLSQNAAYIGTAMLTQKDATAALSKAQTIAAQLSYITVSAAVYAEDYYCTQPSLGGEYFCKMVLNHTNSSNAILKNDIQTVGIAVVRGEFEGKTITCGVICAAQKNVSQSQSMIPDNILTRDTQAPTVTSGKIYVAAGNTLTDAQITEALTIVDERGETPTLTYDLTQVDTQKVGDQTLMVQVSDSAGNKTECAVTIQVASPTLPMILTETLLLPEIDDGELWDLAKYVQASDQYGVASIQTKPMFLKPEEIAAGKMVTVTVTNVYGLTKTTEVTACVEPVAYKTAAQDNQGAGLTVQTLSGEEPQKDGHLLLQCSKVEKGRYYFTVQSPNGVRSTYVRSQNTLVWNPETPGETKVSVVIYNEHGGVFQTSELNIMVADKQIFVYNTLVVSFSQQSGFMIDHGKQWMHKIEPGTTVLDLKEAMAVTGNTGEITVVFKNAQGQEMVDTDLVATGTAVTALEDGAERISYTVLIYGDINGDGQVGIADFAKLRQEMLRGNLVTGIYSQAADVNYDGQVGIADFAKLRQYLLGKIEIEQK